MSDFAARLDAFLDEFFRLNPLHATAAGNHDHDHRWPDLTDAGREERLAFADRWEEPLDLVDDVAGGDAGGLVDVEEAEHCQKNPASGGREPPDQSRSRPCLFDTPSAG